MASKPATKAKTSADPKVATKKPAKAALAVTQKPAATVARTAAPKTNPKTVSKAAPKKVVETVTLKAVFEQLAEVQNMPKKQALAMAAGMVDMVTGILKAGDRVRLSGWESLRSKTARRAWGVIRPLVRRCRSPPARRLHSVLPRSSRLRCEARFAGIRRPRANGEETAGGLSRSAGAIAYGSGSNPNR